VAGLRYKVNKGKRLNGKPRVYFCCHSEDFELYFETISNEILVKHDCVIWFSDKDTQRDEIFYSDLSQMQLFVIPVTRKFLATKNDALDVDFRFAIEKHIPVLPLLQEVGLETLFNEKCKNIQYLDRNVNDKTAISYEEKFTKFLQSVLVEDNIAEKIRDTFDGRIFLSYRKKDRLYAQELMRKIHKNDFCRDLAIWYDEYLTLGEDFSKEIEEAIDSSRLFALVVTPNIVKDNNYVITDEYPEARRLNKAVLAVEMEATNRAELIKNFDEIPDTINAENEEELTCQLSVLFSDLIENPSMKTPEHNFYIGLAYLIGLDVEVDKEKALDLIISSASDGFPDAMEKLVNMYENGDGVPVNNDEAIGWRRRLVRCREEIYLKNNTVVALDNWFVSWLELGRALLCSNRCSDAIAEVEKLYGYCTQKLESRKFHEGLVDENLEFIYLFFSMVSQSWMGEIYRNQGDLKTAEECFLKSIEIGDVMNEKWFDSLRMLREISTAYKNLGMVYLYEKKYIDAMRFFQESAECKKKLVESNDDNLFRLDLSDLYGKIATIYKIHNKLDEAFEIQMESMELVQDGKSQPEQFLYIDGKLKLADIVSIKGDLSTAEKMLHDVLRLVDEYEFKYNEKLSHSKVLCWIKLSQVYYRSNDVDNSRVYVLKAIETGELIREQTGLYFATDVLLCAYAIYLEFLLTEGASVKFRHYSEKAIRLVEEYMAGEAYLFVSDCVAIYGIVGQWYSSCNKPNKAKEMLQKALELVNTHLLFSGSVLTILPALRVYLALADIFVNEEEYQQAELYYVKAATLIEWAQKDAESLVEGLTPAFYYYSCALCCQTESPEKFEFYMMKTINCIDSIPEKKRTLLIEDVLCMACYGMYRLNDGLEKVKWKRIWISKANELRKKYPDDFDDTDTLQAVLEEYS